MSLKQRLFHRVIRQFHDPTGPGGQLVGWVMGRRSSNLQSNRWAVELLDIQPTERVIEFGFWPEPTARLREISQLLPPGGRIALVSQPRCPGATAATSTAAADELAALLSEAGFDDLRVETLDLDPPAVCVLGRILVVPGSRA